MGYISDIIDETDIYWEKVIVYISTPTGSGKTYGVKIITLCNKEKYIHSIFSK